MTVDEMFAWYQQLNGHEFDQALGFGDGQGSLALQSIREERVRHDLATELRLPFYR